MSTYGKVGPVDIDEDMEALQREMRMLGGEDKISILNVTRLQSHHSTPEGWKSTPTITLKIEFRGLLPEKIAIGHMVYKVYPWVSPIFRCFNCWRFGHGQLSCKASTRCARCSLYHRSTDCTNSPKCYFCNGAHRINYTKCPAYLKAREITNAYAGSNTASRISLLQELSKLNPSNKVLQPQELNRTTQKSNASNNRNKSTTERGPAQRFKTSCRSYPVWKTQIELKVEM